jgi:hypothetical protein
MTAVIAVVVLQLIDRAVETAVDLPDVLVAETLRLGRRRSGGSADGDGTRSHGGCECEDVEGARKVHDACSSGGGCE